MAFSAAVNMFISARSRLRRLDHLAAMRDGGPEDRSHWLGFRNNVAPLPWPYRGGADRRGSVPVFQCHRLSRGTSTRRRLGGEVRPPEANAVDLRRARFRPGRRCARRMGAESRPDITAHPSGRGCIGVEEAVESGSALPCVHVHGPVGNSSDHHLRRKVVALDLDSVRAVRRTAGRQAGTACRLCAGIPRARPPRPNAASWLRKGSRTQVEALRAGSPGCTGVGSFLKRTRAPAPAFRRPRGRSRSQSSHGSP